MTSYQLILKLAKHARKNLEFSNYNCMSAGVLVCVCDRDCLRLLQSYKRDVSPSRCPFKMDETEASSVSVSRSGSFRKRPLEQSSSDAGDHLPTKHERYFVEL